MSEVIGNPKQIADLDRINRTAEQLSDLLSRFYADHGQMLALRDIKTITQDSTTVEIMVGQPNQDYVKDKSQG